MSHDPKAPNILVVEDNPANLLLVRALLHRAGYRTSAAAAAEEVAAAIALEMPALILMDVHLPGKDGLTLTRELHADPATAHIPVVALTANAMAGDSERCLAAGCVEYLTKPIQPQALNETLTRLIPIGVGV